MMLAKLVKKEFALAMHPITPLMLLLSAMVFIPNYPYTVSFFYTALALFFTCLSGRENNDVLYTLELPVAKRDVVRGRFAFAALLQLGQIGFTAVCCLLKARLMPALQNEVGLEANAALLGAGLLLYALFDAVFFAGYYRDVTKVGGSFLKASVAVFLGVGVCEAVPHFVPFVRDSLDTVDAAHLPQRLAAFGVCFVVWALALLLGFLPLNIVGFAFAVDTVGKAPLIKRLHSLRSAHGEELYEPTVELIKSGKRFLLAALQAGSDFIIKVF